MMNKFLLFQHHLDPCYPHHRPHHPEYQYGHYHHYYHWHVITVWANPPCLTQSTRTMVRFAFTNREDGCA